MPKVKQTLTVKIQRLVRPVPEPLWVGSGHGAYFRAHLLTLQHRN